MDVIRKSVLFVSYLFLGLLIFYPVFMDLMGFELITVECTQSTELWNRIWGGVEGENCLEVALNGSEIYIVGHTGSYGSGEDDVFLVKYDSDGNEIWSVTWGGVAVEEGQGVIVHENAVYVVGTTFSFGEEYADALLIKFDQDGNQIWNTTWGSGSTYDYGMGLVSSEGYIHVVGYTCPSGSSNRDAFLARFDSDGNQVWNTTWGGIDSDKGFKAAAAEGDIYIVGETWSYGAGEREAFLVKFDSNGNPLWYATWGGASYDSGLGVDAQGSEVYITGCTVNFGAGSYESFLVKFDASGNQLWNTTWGGTGSDGGWDIALNGSEVYLVGYTTSYGVGQQDVLLVNYDSNGDQIWNTTWGRDWYDYGRAVGISGNNVYVVGDTSIFGEHSNALLVKYCVGSSDLYNLSVSNIGSGTTDPSPGTYTHPSGKETSVDAIPDTGWVLDHWELDGQDVGSITPFPLVMNSDHNLTAVFTQIFQGSITWGSFGTDVGCGMETNGSRLYVGGYTTNAGAGGSDAEILVFTFDRDITGDLTWGGGQDENGGDVAIVDDFIYLSGWTMSFGEGSSDSFLVKYDLNLTQIWNATWGGIGSEYGKTSVAALSDCVYLGGITTSFGAGSIDGCLVKFDSEGNKLWNITWGGEYSDTFSDIEYFGDSIYCAGYSSSFGTNPEDALLVKYDDDGNQIWNTTWHVGGRDYAEGIAVTEQGVYVAGNTFYPQSLTYDVFLSKFDHSGTLLWTTVHGRDDDEYCSEIRVVGSDVYVVGYTDSIGAGNRDAILYKFNSEGTKVWETIWGGSQDDEGNDLVVTEENIFIAGYTESYGFGGKEGFLVKYSLPTNEQEIILELTAGWNMVSLPVIPEETSAASVLEGVGFYQLVTWSGTGYVTATDFEAGKGYWLLVLEDVNITISGTPVESLNLTLSPGWSMIGGLNTGVQAADVFPGFYQFVTWTGTGYTPATVFEPGKGYWALVLVETQIQLPPT